MEIQRERYLQKLREYMWNGQIKVITGIRRCGKSYLLWELFRRELLERGVPEDHILLYALDLSRDIRFRNPLELAADVRRRVEAGAGEYYLFVDEIQMSDQVPNPYNPAGKPIRFYDALNDLRSLPQLDIYVTGSNSRMLSSDILTEFRGRSDEIRVHPLSFAEYYSAVGGDAHAAFEDYACFGGMPLLLSRRSDEAKTEYLERLVAEVYLRDIVERKGIRREDVLENVVDLLCSSVGSLTNPSRLTDTLNSRQKRGGENTVAINTVKSYLDALEDAYLFSCCRRYDVKGKSYFDYPNKYYCEDVGLRNARLGFRQQEMTHIMENILYNELRLRGWSVDVGVVYGESDREGSRSRSAREIDFVAARGGRRVYIQSAFAMGDEEKARQEIRPFALTGDAFPKIVIRHDIRRRAYDEQGILHVNVVDFLLDESLL